jgi:hypothetical protein
MKTAKTFRLSAQALASLRYLVDVTGSNETAIVEMALVRFSQTMRPESPYDVPEPPPNFPPYDDDLEPALNVSPARVSRKRHKSRHSGS